MGSGQACPDYRHPRSTRSPIMSQAANRTVKSLSAAFSSPGFMLLDQGFSSLPHWEVRSSSRIQYLQELKFCSSQMASKGSRRGRKRRSTAKPRPTHYEKRSLQVKNQESSTSSSTICSDSTSETSTALTGAESGGEKISGSNCSTPKAQRFRIPKIETCPPAPKKRRVMSSCCLQRRPIAFFAPPDIELFFFFALRGISI
ncbi:cyclin-dependent protein kinase inhibitor SMR9 isoform X1 [Rhodamnia argentea]|uniref:Cyclin-dependent protein kinase inhibitor SMR9 isoform X1 n=1 Tax=Rhodamnia argentea TaxID=178133 RepID=A0A8B8NGG8_9MYRT|nr:cyclin-dependent protein kinase inhibitor SMR9 isoform X1 [Rhodamnia argentea]